MDGLTPGRIVHYVDEDGGHRAAIIVKTYHRSTEVDLVVFAPCYTPGKGKKQPVSEIREHVHVSLLQKSIGTWHWIEQA